MGVRWRPPGICAPFFTGARGRSPRVRHCTLVLRRFSYSALLGGVGGCRRGCRGEERLSMGISIGALSEAPTLTLHSESATLKPYGGGAPQGATPRLRFSAAGVVDGCRGACGRCEELFKVTRRCERSFASPFEALGESATPKPKVESEAGGGTYVFIFCGVGSVDGLR